MKLRLSALFILLVILVSGCEQRVSTYNVQLENIPEYDEKPYVILNENIPYFTKDDYTYKSYESYGELDYLGRCTAAIASIGKDIMPTEERGAIGQVKPSGWQIAKYDFIDGKYLYNRCHLLGFQLTGENANTKNLITGTRYMNVEGMLPFENMVAEYIEETDNHVLMRVTPVYEGENLLASGVVMEALSMEDSGEGICFNVYCYNVQPGVIIDYATGDNAFDYIEEKETIGKTGYFILNISSKKVHKPDCESVGKMKEKNKKEYSGLLEDIINGGYSLCNICNP